MLGYHGYAFFTWMSLSHRFWCKQEAANVILAAFLCVVVVYFSIMAVAIEAIDCWRSHFVPTQFSTEWKRGHSEVFNAIYRELKVTWFLFSIWLVNRMNVLNFYLHNIEELHYDLTLLTNNIGIKKTTKTRTTEDKGWKEWTVTVLPYC